MLIFFNVSYVHGISEGRQTANLQVSYPLEQGSCLPSVPLLCQQKQRLLASFKAGTSLVSVSTNKHFQAATSGF